MTRWTPDAAGRLSEAAFRLFSERGYAETTIAEIAEAAGLTERTFFRHYADKREVLFDGAGELQTVWVEGIRSAPREHGPLAAVVTGLDRVAELFADRHPFAKIRSRIVESTLELRERELIKLQSLAVGIGAELVERGVRPNGAILAAQTGVTVFHVAFARWIAQDDTAQLPHLIADTLAELQALTATT